MKLRFLLSMVLLSGSGAYAMFFPKEDVGEAVTSTVTFKDVIGADEAKRSLDDLVKLLQKPECYARVGARLPKGVLLEGEPGNGKTLLAKALAGEAGVKFLAVTGSTFTAPLCGMGVDRVKSLFKKARDNAPCIIFIDEIDGLGTRGNSGMLDASVENTRIINEFLAQMDGMTSDKDKPVIIIGATNYKENVDEAMRRSGRIDTIVRVENPSQDNRVKILQLYAQKITVGKVNFNLVAQKAEDFSGADLENLVNQAAIYAAREEAYAVDQRHFEAALEKIKKGKSKQRKEKFDFLKALPLFEKN